MGEEHDSEDEGADGADDQEAKDAEGDDGSQDDDGQKDDDTGEKDGDKPQDGGEDDEPPVRKTKSEFIKERLARKKAKQAKTQDNDGEDEDEEVAPEDEALIDKVIQKRYGQVFKSIEEKEQAAADKDEAMQFFADSPEFKPYEAKILKWWSDPSRKHLPISTVALEAVGYKNLLKLGAQKEREAADKSKQTRVTGGGAKEQTGKKSVGDMSFEEIRKMNAEIISKRADY